MRHVDTSQTTPMNLKYRNKTLMQTDSHVSPVMLLFPSYFPGIFALGHGQGTAEHVDAGSVELNRIDTRTGKYNHTTDG